MRGSLQALGLVAASGLYQRPDQYGLVAVGSRGYDVDGAAYQLLDAVHVGPRLSGHGAMERAIGDMKKIYDGQVVFSDELMSFDL